MSLGLAFGGFIWWSFGTERAEEYFTGFLIEKSLALDNIFVIALIFSYLGIPRVYQHRVLIWGIIGVLMLRGLMVGIGTVLVQNFAWMLHLLGAFLVYTGIRMWTKADRTYEVSASAVFRLVQKRLRLTGELYGPRFFVKLAEPGHARRVWFATPLFLALLMVELADVVFAIDSLPAIFAVTTDPFIVYTSNIFAILGLRALYFTLAALMHRFRYLKYAVALLLVFIGSKISIADLAGFPEGKFPADWSLGITLVIVVTGIGLSIWRTRREHQVARNLGEL